VGRKTIGRTAENSLTASGIGDVRGVGAGGLEKMIILLNV
jgi:hypothetical protein